MHAHVCDGYSSHHLPSIKILFSLKKISNTSLLLLKAIRLLKVTDLYIKQHIYLIDKSEASLLQPDC